MTLLSLLFLALLAAPATSNPFLVLTGNVTCALEKPFSYQITIINNDIWGAEEISAGPLNNVTGSSHFYNFTLGPDNNNYFATEFDLKVCDSVFQVELTFQIYYSVFLNVTHNCNANSVLFRTTFIPVGLCSIYKTENFNKNLDITNSGKWVARDGKFGGHY